MNKKILCVFKSKLSEKYETKTDTLNVSLLRTHNQSVLFRYQNIFCILSKDV